MKFTCLGKGGGFHYPPCHMLETCGFRILFDFPLDLSALRIFSPVPTCFSSSLDEETPSCLGSDCQKGEENEKPLIANDLIYAEPWYKTVKNLHLWNAAFIDVVLISSPMGMLGLPFLTRMKGFSAKIYATEATARVGQLMMEELVSMHMELRQIYGAEESDFPQWMKWKDLELLPSALRERILGKDGGELGGWMPLYSAVDVKDCIQKVQALKYAEATCYNGTLVIKAFSSGLEIGGCNWTINCTKGDIGFISSSIFVSGHAMDFDYCSLKGNELILFSDFSSLDATENLDNDFSVQSINDLSPPRNNSNNCEEFTRSLLAEDNLEEREKLAFLCSCVVDSVKSGGSVLIPINRLGIVLQLLEQISDALDSSNMKEPCIVFSPHWSLRLGSAVHLLQRWCGDQNSLLLLENGVDAELALLPFKPMAMKVLQCSFLSGIKLQNVQPLLETLQAKFVLFPEELKQISFSKANSFSLLCYSENETLHIPRLKESSEVDIAMDLASQFHFKKLKQENISVTRLNGELSLYHGKHRLLSGNKETRLKRPLVHWGSLDVESLLTALSRMGIKATVEQGMSDCDRENVSLVNVHEPGRAFIEIKPASTVITAGDENLASLIFEAIGSIVDGI
nr:integrator complex subunit 9 isoform X4 [Ziziphus jujuba var. spinosa]